MKENKTLGIDPGSRHLGFGVVSRSGSQMRIHAHGTLHFKGDIELNIRVLDIYKKVKELLIEYKPAQVAIEKVFFAKNVLSALKLGQARGAAILAVVEAGIPLFEYSPNEIKRAVVGHGHAAKEQVARMITLISGVKDFESADASDALAIAICHLNTYIYKERVLQKE